MVFLFGVLISTNLKNSIYFPREELEREEKKDSDECGQRCCRIYRLLPTNCSSDY